MMEILFGNRNFYGRYSNKEYYQQFHVFNTLKDLEKLLDHGPEHHIASRIAVNFNVMAFGDSRKEVRKKLGKPLHRIDNSANLPGHEKLFYKLNFGVFTAVSQMHFLHDEFFLGQYFFNRIELSKLTLTKELLIQKYAGQPVDDVDNFIIYDQHQNKIRVTNESFGIVHYISGSSLIRNKLREAIEAEQNQVIVKDQLKRGELFSLL
jgi:hypothetical protein